MGLNVWLHSRFAIAILLRLDPFDASADRAFFGGVSPLVQVLRAFVTHDVALIVPRRGSDTSSVPSKVILGMPWPPAAKEEKETTFLAGAGWCCYSENSGRFLRRFTHPAYGFWRIPGTCSRRKREPFCGLLAQQEGYQHLTWRCPEGCSTSFLEMRLNSGLCKASGRGLRARYSSPEFSERFHPNSLTHPGYGCYPGYGCCKRRIEERGECRVSALDWLAFESDKGNSRFSQGGKSQASTPISCLVPCLSPLLFCPALSLLRIARGRLRFTALMSLVPPDPGLVHPGVPLSVLPLES
jgi:hypothetical protein